MTTREDLLIPNINPKLQSLPEKFYTLRPNQIIAISAILEQFKQGRRVVVLDAPTGSGKTLIGEVVRRMLGVRGSFVCSGKDLQSQFSRDFGAPILMGRSNYTPSNLDDWQDGLNCADCLDAKNGCDLCDSKDTCPYNVARWNATIAPIAALNSHYWLNSVQGSGSPWHNRGLTIFDECDTLENVAMSQAEVYISDKFATRWRIEAPAKLTVRSAWIEWGLDTLNKLRIAREKVAGDPFKKARQRDYINNLGSTIDRMLADLDAEIPWIYTGGAGSDKRTGNQISFKPVMVDEFAKTRMWPHDKRFLLMSGTVVSASMTVEDLGLEEQFGSVSIGSSFPTKNRQVIVVPAQDMSRRGIELSGGTGRMEEAIGRIVESSPERILIHSVSYGLSRTIAGYLHSAGALQRRSIVSYAGSSDRATAIRDYMETPGAVLVAPSAERGIDLYDGLCRVQIIAKVPFPYLGDQQIAARMHARNGNLWYQLQVARTVMQMVGRGVRHDTDWCVTYILDSQFVKHWEGWKQLYPKWFQRSVRFTK